ncbi:hypothetical protein [Brevundimonas sp.]|uniref:hypothetical protein n=1 Tax=Brevundimonas sp. TaxID=1871086 RepID=UPI0035B32CDB
MSVFALIALAALASDDPAEGVVVTAPAGVTYVAQAPLPDPDASAEPTPHGLSTQEQIDAYLAAGRAADQDPRDPDRYADADLDALPSYDRRTYIDAGYSFGSNGYQGYHVSMIAPLGDNVTVGLSYSKSEGGIPSYGYGYGYLPYAGPIGVRPDLAPAGERTSVGASLRVDWSDDDNDPATRRGSSLR